MSTREDSSTGYDYFCTQAEIIAQFLPSVCKSDRTPRRISTGTSFSTPFVSALSAAMISYNSTFAYWPEMITAAIMAGATNNIPLFAYNPECQDAGPKRDPITSEKTYYWGCSTNTNRLSDHDGAGGINAEDTYNILINNWYSPYTIPKTTSSNQIVAAKQIYVNSGNTIRAVISWIDDFEWASNHAYRIGVDFDLVLVNGNGPQVAFSSSWNNNYEIIEYQVTQSDFYYIRVYAYQWNIPDASKFLGMAYIIFPTNEDVHPR